MLSPPDKINLRFGDSHGGYSECVYERKSVLSVCALVMLCMSLLGASCEAIINTMVSLAMQTSGHRVPKETEMKIKKKKKRKTDFYFLPSVTVLRLELSPVFGSF